MTDPRCNCAEPDCPICSAPVHRPWQPQPGTSPDPVDPREAQIKVLLEYIGNLERKIEGNRWIMLRRYILVLLMTGLGSMIGSAITLSVLN